jgi:hypothetical protein
MHPSWNSSASGSWQRAAYWRLTIPTNPRLALMNRCQASSPRPREFAILDRLHRQNPCPLSEHLALAGQPRSCAAAGQSRCCLAGIPWVHRRKPQSCRHCGPGRTTYNTWSDQICGYLSCAGPVEIYGYLSCALSLSKGTRAASTSSACIFSLRRQCCGYAAPCGEPRARRARRTSGCTCAVVQPGSYAAAWTSAPRWYASR